MSPCPSNWVRKVTADTELQQQHTLSTPHLTSSGLVQHINGDISNARSEVYEWSCGCAVIVTHGFNPLSLRM